MIAAYQRSVDSGMSPEQVASILNMSTVVMSQAIEPKFDALMSGQVDLTKKVEVLDQKVQKKFEVLDQKLNNQVLLLAVVLTTLIITMSLLPTDVLDKSLLGNLLKQVASKQ